MKKLFYGWGLILAGVGLMVAKFTVLAPSYQADCGKHFKGVVQDYSTNKNGTRLYVGQKVLVLTSDIKCTITEAR